MAATIIDRRGDEYHPVWSYEFDQLSWAAAVSTAQAVDLPINGILRGLQITLNASTNNVTVDVEILDADDNLILLISNDQADDGTLFVEDTAWLDGNCQVQVTPSGVPGASTLTVDIKAYGE